MTWERGTKSFHYFASISQIDMPFLVATRWIVPAGVAASGNIPNFLKTDSLLNLLLQCQIEFLFPKYAITL